jgi:uncharacterized membrane protein YhaH (DUF805 family)
MLDVIRGLGVKRTLGDPTGSKHRLAFWAFCLGMVLLIAVLILVRAS